MANKVVSGFVCIAIGALSLIGCSPDQASPPVHDNDWVIDQLNARMGGNPDTSTGGPRELHFLVRQQMGSEEVICGWTGFASRQVNGVPSPTNDAIFIFRNGHLYLAQDMPPEQFVQWQDKYCGDKWVKPIGPGGVS